MRNYLPFIALFVFLSHVATAQVSVLTQHNDNTRAGYNTRETKLTTSNVNARQFGKAFSLTVDDQIYAQPLVVANVLMNKSLRNVVYIATVNNSVYAYDGDNGTLYWQKNFTVAGQRPPKNTDMTGACGGSYRDFIGNIGIVGTPVIDSALQTIYFVARSTSNGTSFVHYLHAVSIIDGSERTGSPVQITASAAGNGPGNVNNVVSFDPQKNNQRPALTLSKGIVYIGFSSHCDWQDYHGWLLGYDESTLQQKVVFNASANGREAGIWESGGGAAVDNLGNLYIVTGNGTVGYNGDPTNPINRGESALKLTPSGSTLTIASYFTPFNYNDLEASDLDYGSMGSFLIPNSNYYFTGCKDGNLYLLNKDAMGSYSAAANGVQQNINLSAGKTLRSQPSYFKGTSTEFVYVWSENDALRAYPFNRTNNLLDVNNQVVSAIAGPTGANGAVLSVSSNGGKNGTGILWASYAATGDANQSIRPGILRAFDANNITTELWDNSQNATRDNAGNYAKFSAPTIANGHVYLPTFSNQVVVYGVIDTTSAPPGVCSTTNIALNKPAVASSSEAGGPWGPANAFDGNATTRWSSAFSDPQWIYVDLGQIDSVCNVKLSWQSAYGKNFQIQISDDAQTWTTLATITGNTSFTNNIGVVGRGRYVRMYGTVRASQYGYSLYEFVVNGKILSNCLPPANLVTKNITTNSVTLKWGPTGSASYNVQYRPTTSNQYKTITTTADSVTIAGLGCTTNYVWQVESVCGTTTSTYSQSAFSTLTCTNCGLLPTRVFSNDIGNVNIVGEACYTGITSYNVKGSGKDISQTADQFRYVYKTFSGDGTLQVKVTSQDQTSTWNKAGLMFSSTADSSSANEFMAITSGNGIAYQYRPTEGAYTTTPVIVAGLKAPYFLRMVKLGQVYTSYSSPDSINWTQVYTRTSALDANGPISGGLAVTSHNNNTLSTVQFDQAAFYFASVTDVNIALNKPSYGSNYDNVSHTGNYANDGSVTTRWASLANANPQWYYIDLGQPFKINRVNIAWDANYAQNYQVQTSNDAVTWTTVQQITGNTVPNNSLLLSGTPARFVRLNLTKSSANAGFSIDEFQIFGDSIPNTTPNIAKGQPATSSSNSSAGFAAANAVDGDFTTRWASGTTDPQWIYVDLGNTYNITNVNITWELDAALNYTVQISPDAVNWTTMQTITNNTAYYNALTVSGQGRYVRINCTTKNGGTDYSIYDLQVLGTQVLAPKTAALRVNNTNIDKFKAYPNPTSGRFSVDFVSPITQDIVVQITDARGNVIQTQTLSKFSGEYHLPLDITDALPGNYIIAVKTAQGILSGTVIKL
jgi:hypothetical protein